MSWWNNTVGIGSLASQALKNAQSKIDKVLDIQGEGKDDSTSNKPVIPSVPEEAPEPADTSAGDDSEFWNTWIKPGALGAKGPSTPASGGPEPVSDGGTEDWSGGQFFSSTISSSLSKVKSLQKKVEASSLLRKKSEIDAGSPLVLKPNDVADGSVKVSKEASKPVTEPLEIVVPEAKAIDVKTDEPGAGLLTTGTSVVTTETTSLNSEAKAVTMVTQNDCQNVADEDVLLEDMEASQSGWGDDVSLSLITDSQMSSASSATVDTTDMVTVTKDESCDKSVEDKDKDKTEPEKDTPETVDNVSEVAPVQSTLAVAMTAEATDEGAGESAWDIGDLTESALNVEDLVSTDTPVVDNEVTQQATTEPAVEEDFNETKADDTQTESNETPAESTNQSINDLANESTEEPTNESISEPTDEPIPETLNDSVSNKTQDDSVNESFQNDSVAEENQISTAEDQEHGTDEEIPAQESIENDTEDSSTDIVQPMMDSDELPPSSMEDSTDTQEELSDGNRTLTTEELNRMSSESSQATLELGPDDEEESIEEQTSPQSQSSVAKDESTTPQRVSSKDNLTSSSYVKNMLEEAMVESMKDTDSHSSSDMVRIESSPTSGHTSADEIETNTSSDIEIISHISTPTPNGESRLFDLSPLRHALSRSLRRNSPPLGHKRSDSSSSGQSRNGEDHSGGPDATPTGRAPRKQKPHDPVTDSSALETEKLLKEVNHPTPLQPIQESMEQSTSSLDSDQVTMVTITTANQPVVMETELLSDSNQLAESNDTVTFDLADMEKKLAETAEILDARERKLLDLSRENMDLVESNNILRQQLLQSEEARESEMTDLNMLTEEFTKRMSEAEQKIQAVIREKEAMRKKLTDTEAELVKRANDKASERIMREKDQQIAELLEEGEKLSKQQLQSNNIIKKLRVKEKESDSLLKSQKQKLDNHETEIDRLQSILDVKVDNEKKQNDAISQLNSAVLTQEVEINRLKSELEDSVEKIRSMQVILDNSYKEIGELHKAKASRASEVQEKALSNEIKARKDVQDAMEHYQQRARADQEGLLTQIEDHRLSINRMEKENARREDILRQEISNLQRRLQEAEDRNQELTESVTQATRPLLRQIENLQSTYAVQVASYEKVERNLTERLGDSQTSLALAQDKERTANDRMIEVDVKLSTLESQVSNLRQDKSKLQAGLELERAKLEVLEDTKNNKSAQLEAIKHNYEHENNEIRKEKIMLDNQLEMEKMKTETERKKVILLQEQLREKEIQWGQARLEKKVAASPTPTYSRESSSVDLTLVDTPLNLSQHEDVLEKTLMFASSNGSKTSSLYESLRQASATTIVESLQSQLKMRDGEITQLQTEISELERTREAMARELVSLSNTNEELGDQVKELPEYQAKYKDLDQRYQALLQMYGEKVEQAEELKLDLQDIKDMYKQQINELLQNQ